MFKTRPLILTAVAFAASALVYAAVTAPQPARAAVRSIVFPVLGGGQFSNDFNAPRSNGAHHATDIFAAKHTKLVSAVDGTITFVGYPQPSWGYAVFIRDSAGYTYRYIHINNDAPGTDDGRGGAMHAYAADMKPGNKVVRGQHLGYLGDSGNAETTPPHLHFEISAPDGTDVNPYDSLRAAPRLANPANYPALSSEVLPYGGSFRGGASLAMGQFDLDPLPEYVTGAGPSGGPHIKLYDYNDKPLSGFFAFASAFTGGVDVATGDIDGDGLDEIITAAGGNGGPHVKVFGRDGSLRAGWFAYESAFRGGVRVSAGDLDGDGRAEIVTAPARSRVATVKVFGADGTERQAFNAYGSGFTGGADVAVGDTDGDGTNEIITGAGPGGGPHVRVLTSAGVQKATFFAYASSFYGGLRLDAGNVRITSPADEITVVPATVGGPHAKLFGISGTTAVTHANLFFMEEWWQGAAQDTAAGFDTTITSAGGNRRTTVRAGVE